LKSAIRKWGDCEPSQIGLKSNRDPLVSGNIEIFHLSADYRERSDKIATMSVNPKSTQQPVTSREASVRVVGFARNVLSLFIESYKMHQIACESKGSPVARKAEEKSTHRNQSKDQSRRSKSRPRRSLNSEWQRTQFLGAKKESGFPPK
jgi:hypothetical protein